MAKLGEFERWCLQLEAELAKAGINTRHQEEGEQKPTVDSILQTVVEHSELQLEVRDMAGLVARMYLRRAAAGHSEAVAAVEQKRQVLDMAMRQARDIGGMSLREIANIANLTAATVHRVTTKDNGPTKEAPGS